MAEAFVAVLRRHAAEVKKLEGAQAEEFLRLLRELQDSLRGRLAVIGGQADAIDAVRLRQVLAETEVGIRALEAKASVAFGATQREAAELAVEHLGTEVGALSRAFDGHTFAVNIDAVKVLADPGQALLANHFESSVERYGLDLLNDVRRRLFVGLRAGDTTGDIAASISGVRGPFGTIGRSNAERLVRTETSQAYGAAQHASIAQAADNIPGLKKVWIHVGSYLCKICGPLHGTERPIDGTWTIQIGKKTVRVAHAPGHPRCVCRVAAMKPSWRRGIEKLGYLKKQPGDDEPGAARL